LTQNLALVGIKPRRSTLVGMIEAMSDRKRPAWLHRLNALGHAAA
jgi:putative NADPH-quinone reductase